MVVQFPGYDMPTLMNATATVSASTLAPAVELMLQSSQQTTFQGVQRSSLLGYTNQTALVYAPEFPYETLPNGSLNGQFVTASGNVTAISCDEDFHTDAFFEIVIYVMYISILLLALLGNGIVCFIVQSSPRMRTVTNFFIANLAIGDILMSFFCVPFSFVSTFVLGYWPFGAILCRVVNYSQAVSVLVSAYTLVAISFDRYIAIMWPLRPRITKR